MTDPDRTNEIRDIAVPASAAAKTLGQSLSRKADSTEVRWIVVVACLLTAAVSIGVSTAAMSSSAAANATAAAAERSAMEGRRQAADAVTAASLANEELKRRGQQPVSIPPQRDDNVPETLVAAATARVLAAMPEGARLDAASLGPALAVHFAANPIRVPPDLVAAFVASFLRDNPPASGPTGETGQPGQPGTPGKDGADGQPGAKGDKGDTPTAAEIMTAFNTAVAENPSLLCAGKGTFVLVKGVLTVPDPKQPGQQTLRDIWTCEPTS